MLSPLSMASGFDITRIYASGDMFFADYSSEYSVDPDKDTFSVVLDHETQEVRYAFTNITRNALTGDILRSHTRKCAVDPYHSLYPNSLELAENMHQVSFFIVRMLGNTCLEVKDIQYREALTEVEFNCENGYTHIGQSVYVVGNTPQLGEWDTSKAMLLNPEQYPLWSGSVMVEQDSDIEWKCIKRDEVDVNTDPEWQSGDNNIFNSGHESYSWGRF